MSVTDVIYITKKCDSDLDKQVDAALDEVEKYCKKMSLRFVYFPEILNYYAPMQPENVNTAYTGLINMCGADVKEHGLMMAGSNGKFTYREIEGNDLDDLYAELRALAFPKWSHLMLRRESRKENTADEHLYSQEEEYEKKFDEVEDSSICYDLIDEGRDVCRYRICSSIGPETFDDDKDEEDEIKLLSHEVIERVDRLKELGVEYADILALLQIKPKLSRMVITERFRIILPDYQETEILMRPISKALYFLFLRHPEGIVFKDLPDYREELRRIYSKVSNLSSEEAQDASIDAVLNPLQNTINVTCSRIKEAFYEKFSEELAEHYVVTGRRGQAKMIKLSRGLVEWRCDLD